MAASTFGASRGAEAAAGMAYYALFSLFPLVLLLVAIGSFVLEQQQAFMQTIAFLNRIIPVSNELIFDNVREVLELRGAVGVVGLIASVWAAMGFFTVLSRNVGRAWPGVQDRGFWQQRLVALSMIAILSLLLVLSLSLTAVLSLLARWPLPAWIDPDAWPLVAPAIPWLFSFFLYLGLYRWVPNTRVSWRAAFGAALVASVAWQMTSTAFSWYVSSGLARYRLLYGSVGTIVALLFWVYLTSWIILFGAHLSAAIAHRQTRSKSR